MSVTIKYSIIKYLGNIVLLLVYWIFSKKASFSITLFGHGSCFT